MLSRLTLIARQGRSIPLAAALRPSVNAVHRLISTTPNHNAGEEVAAVAEIPEQSLWDKYKEKAGNSAPLVFGVGLTSFLLSKEYYICNEETVVAVVFGGVLWLGWSKLSTPINEFIEKQQQDIMDMFYDNKNTQMDNIKSQINEEQKLQDFLSCRNEMFNIAKERDAMALELEYRKRLHEVHDEVKNRLDYHVEVVNLQHRLEEAHIANWVEDQVRKSITPQQEKDTLAQCIKDVKSLVQARV